MTNLVNQPSSKPTRKMSAVIGGGTASTLLIWAASQAGVDLPEEVAGLLVALAAALSGWFVRERA